jgi:signal transduction histidine kinase
MNLKTTPAPAPALAQPRLMQPCRESQVEHDMLRKDGARVTVEAHGQTVDIAGRRVRFTTVRDITRHKQVEELLQSQARHLEKLVQERTARLQEAVAEMEAFSYSIAHDLRAPLRAMHGYAELLLEENCLDETNLQARDFLQRIISAASRMDALILDALNYSKLARGEMPLEPVDTGALLCDIVESYPNLQPHKERLELQGHFPLVLANQAALTQCFSNLLDNAVKFVVPGTKPHVRVRAEKRQDRVRLWFEDNGIGIPKGREKELFQLFKQIDTAHGGTGVGLAIVRKAAERMGGHVGVESEPGKGSRFWLELAEAPGVQP